MARTDLDRIKNSLRIIEQKYADQSPAKAEAKQAKVVGAVMNSGKSDKQLDEIAALGPQTPSRSAEWLTSTRRLLVRAQRSELQVENAVQLGSLNKSLSTAALALHAYLKDPSTGEPLPHIIPLIAALTDPATFTPAQALALTELWGAVTAGGPDRQVWRKSVEGWPSQTLLPPAGWQFVDRVLAQTKGTAAPSTLRALRRAVLRLVDQVSVTGTVASSGNDRTSIPKEYREAARERLLKHVTQLPGAAEALAVKPPTIKAPAPPPPGYAYPELKSGGTDADDDELREFLADKALPPMVREAIEKGFTRFGRLSDSAATIQEGWLRYVADLPYAQVKAQEIDLNAVRGVLDETHQGLDDVKTAIVEFMAVEKLGGKNNILALRGPPGVGKTSVAKSVAKAMGRAFVRVALGSVRDEAEIRGHRRTYTGALPGRIIAAVKQSGVPNPVICLDEIDKLGSEEGRGDPTGALLEVLDRQQNSEFVDHFVDLPYDLSNVQFIVTANDGKISGPLADRMEFIELSGYTREEKLGIATRHLVPGEVRRAGLASGDIVITQAALMALITSYTQEPGVRDLERRITQVARRIALQKGELGEKFEPVTVDEKNLASILGPPRVEEEQLDKELPPGVARGLAWTSAGGETLEIQVGKSPGNGQIGSVTGKLGEVMQESIKVAFGYILTHVEQLGLQAEDLTSHNYSLHIPSGAIPKDGPSAGVTIATALVSAALGKPVRGDVAMTGEIDLRGRVLPVGGVKEKILAAYHLGVQTVIIPKANQGELARMDPAVLAKVDIVLASTIDDVLQVALQG